MRVVIAEDVVLLREGVARVLEAAGMQVVAEVGDARALVTAVVTHRPDLAVVDVRLPPTFTDEGARAVSLLRRRFPRLTALVLSSGVEPRLAGELVRERPSGLGYLLKDRVLDTAEFVAAVRAVASGSTLVDEEVVARLLAHNAGRLGHLSPRELEVLERLAQGATDAAIAADLVVSERTVHAHVRAILGKLGLEPGPDRNRRVQAAVLWLHGGIGTGTDAADPVRP